MRARLPRGLGLLILLASLTTSPAVRAQAPSELAQRALGHYQRGMAAYRGGHYDEAIEAFNRAYQVDPAPILVFNIAQAHWKKGDREPALEAYRRYLSLDPAAANRAQVEARIRELAAVPEPPPPQPVTPEPPTPTTPVEPARPVALMPVAPPPPPVLLTSQPAEDRPPFYRRGLFWSVVGAVAAGAVIAVVVATRSGGDHWSCADCNWAGARVP